jgi:hypothetical protein
LGGGRALRPAGAARAPSEDLTTII